MLISICTRRDRDPVLKIQCRNLGKSFPNQKGTIHALRGLTFTVVDQEFLCIVGPSGCGKTTLLELIAGLQAPTQGDIRLDDERDAGGSRPIMVFQNHGLFPWMTVLENVAFGLEMQEVSRKERHGKAHDLIERFGLSEFADVYPHVLSGGMQQRVGIARAFISNADVLLLDEPFGSLDAQSRTLLQEELLRIWGDQRKLVIHVTHDIEESLLLGDRVLVMTGRPGSIREDMQVPIRRPRTMESRNQSDFVELKRHIWELLEEEVRENLRIRK